MSDDFSEIEHVCGALVRSLSAGDRRNLMRAMARKLAISQRQRITANRAPDGSGYEPRKDKSPPVQGRGAACFLYPSGGGGAPRKVIMKSFTWGAGRMMTGFDIMAGGIRSFEFDKIVQWLPVPDEHKNRSNPRRRGGLRRRTMFRRLASSKFLRVNTSDSGFWIGFTGKVAEIADVHHSGLRDRPSLKAQMTSYPKRELLGATDADKDMLMDMILGHFSNH
ncbi:phage virion morphogenesis protein [Sphingopyxis yananensis]|uniref:phage virion morphogenesis protein n=1 Tax=Sphingopyxis yananensis TaxID=2886687 RepID=UPI001D1259E9|nr:phage virion morphogenesis protein [Sphingopyxis yananensis]MCC2603018.1 phage virion morphogenesis protein [Sphingopyxis yananensis]